MFETTRRYFLMTSNALSQKVLGFSEDRFIENCGLAACSLVQNSQSRTFQEKWDSAPPSGSKMAPLEWLRMPSSKTLGFSIFEVCRRRNNHFGLCSTSKCSVMVSSKKASNVWLQSRGFQIFCNGFTHVQTTPWQVLKALEFRIKILFFFRESFLWKNVIFVCFR